MQTTVNELGTTLKKTVEEITNSFEHKDDDFLPVFAFSPEDGDNVILAIDPEYFKNDERKDLLVEDVIVPTAHNLGAKLIGSVVSAWTSQVPRDHEGDLPRPSEDPDRKEAVFITVMDSLTVTGWQAEILRDGTNPPRLGEWVEIKGGNVLSGRFVEPLQDALRDSSGRMDPQYLDFLRKRTIDLSDYEG